MWSRRRLWIALAGASVLVSGCPAEPGDPDADGDASRVRRDAYADDAFVDPTIDAYLDPATDAYLLDAVVIDAAIPPRDIGAVDAVHIDAAPDGGPIRGCEGVVTPPSPCTNDDECRERGMTRCVLEIHGQSVCPIPCLPVEVTCMTDVDCETMASSDDAGTTDDAGPPRDAGVLVCNVYNPQCACPTYACEAPCSCAGCPTASCATDGYMCPDNADCTPGDLTADEHGCAPRRCVTSADCDCGFCTGLGLCANGAGTCE